MARNDDDWDSDDDSISSIEELETSVHLGLPDGALDSPTDLGDAAVSRIGGPPAIIINSEPPITSSHCKICNTPMELLVQFLCPFEDSPYDRALYIWGCSNAACQTKSTPKGGSVRAWRGLRFNTKYAAKLEARKAAQKKKAEAAAAAIAATEQNKPKVNPFSAAGFTGNTNTFGTGFNNSIFGTSPDAAPDETPEPDQDDASSEEMDSELESLTLATRSFTLSDSEWKACPTYPPVYMSTISEFIPGKQKSKSNNDISKDDLYSSEGGGGGGGGEWMAEAYENSMNLDQVFERFSKRVSFEGEQCLRYDVRGVPLPFASDQVFDALFPQYQPQPGEAVTITKSQFAVTPATHNKREYSLKGRKAQELVPPCSICGSERIFECQVMPNLLNVCSKVPKGKNTTTPLSNPGPDALKEDGMEWGTCMIFCCEKDCCIPDSERDDGQECWREEVVLIQWDT